MLVEELTAHGHANVRATHESTLEITTDDWLTPAGDCIVAVGATQAPAEFAEPFVAACQRSETEIALHIDTDHGRATIRGHGAPNLTFESERSLVCRTSGYVDDRTVMIEADRAAAGLDRDIVEALRTEHQVQAVLESRPEGTYE